MSIPELFLRRGIFPGPNVRVTQALPNEPRSESALAVDPHNPNRIVGVSKRFTEPHLYRFTLGAVVQAGLNVMVRLHNALRAGVVAVCILVPCSQAAGALVTADLRNSPDIEKLGNDDTTSFEAFSQQRQVVNDEVDTRLISNGITIGAPAAVSRNEKITVRGKDGKKQEYGPPVMALRNQKKSLMKKPGDVVGVALGERRLPRTGFAGGQF